ncbi:Ribosomal protein S18 acetylase RimI [Microlunatus sagamiharensis]|uniref:Ribosomal protein S18 acetylase RimI n=1 Tax=Microlunatus sagamiharensis TaxID=546874 RepID=A0A1H2LKM8_9ACTN|nr:GNAT family N-acetyltransferase [Microlunatus sagamiharensis]SDU81567.1 Ribosomal protein S18 acetylase RimI [Microlunatus sagamiharensis]
MPAPVPLEVVALTPDDWARWRTLRLAALAEAPYAFGSTLAGTLADDGEAYWRARLTTVPHNLVVVLAGQDAGMVSLVAPDPADGSPELISMWVSPHARGTGAADAAVEAVLAVADGEHPGRPVTLSVFADNAAATRLYRRHGFVDAGPSPDDDRERRMVRLPTASAR